jgi:hypothetical protein
VAGTVLHSNFVEVSKARKLKFKPEDLREFMPQASLLA